METYYVVLSVVSKADVVSPLGRKETHLRMTDGQVGILPVFATRAAAEKYVSEYIGKEQEIIEVETVSENVDV